jgi:ABC-type antimicrobial peptide transport system permease subunit
MTVTVRGGEARSAGSLLPAIRSEVRALDPNIALRSIETVAEAVSREVAPTRFYMLLVSIFAALALILAAIGLYGVLAYLVSRRSREIGLRVALGARQQEIVRMVVSEGLRPVLLGAFAGLAVSFWGARVLEAVLYDVTSRDPWTFAMVPVILLLTALVAMLIPARRASRVDPVEALSAE